MNAAKKDFENGFRPFKHSLRIYGCRRPLRIEHFGIIKASKCRKGSIQLQASWSNRRWSVIADLLGVFSDWGLAKSIGVHEPACNDAGTAHQMWLTRTWYDLVLRMLQVRFDSKAALSECPPHSWFGVCDNIPKAAQDCYRRMRGERDMIVAALSKIESLPLDSDLALVGSY